MWYLSVFVADLCILSYFKRNESVSNGDPRIAAWLICVGSFSILGGGGGAAMPTSILVEGYCKNVHTRMHAHAHQCT